MLSVRCVGARWTKVGDEAKLEFDFEVSYCGRVAVVLGVFAEGIADCLGAVFKRELRELRAVDGGSYAALRPLCRCRSLLDRCRKREDPRRRKAPAVVGRVLAKRFMVLHRSLAVLLDAYSPRLLEEVLQVDVDRIWREEEPRLARLLDPRRAQAPGDVLYVVDGLWLEAWRKWAFWAPPKDGAGAPGDAPSPPGPLSDGRLRRPPRPPLAPLQLGKDYRAVSPSLFAYFARCHGHVGRPLPRYRADPSLRGAAARPARPLAVARVHAFLRAAARNRRPVGPDVDLDVDALDALDALDLDDAPTPPPPPARPSARDTTCCISPPAKPDRDAAGVELPTLSPLHAALAATPPGA